MLANIELAGRERAAQIELRRRQLANRIGMALSSTRDVYALLELFLAKVREITGADAGSLYLVERPPEGGHRLRFKLTQNDSMEFPFSEIIMPITETSTAGYVTLRGEVNQSAPRVRDSARAVVPLQPQVRPRVGLLHALHADPADEERQIRSARCASTDQLPAQVRGAADQ